MTREEAIDKLQWLWNEVYNEDCDGSDYAEAIDMAISSLQEPSDDIEGDIDFHCDLKHNKMTWFNNTTESPNEIVEKNDEVIDHDKEWIIGCIKHDGFIKTDRFDKANQIILDALSAEKREEEYADEIARRIATIIENEQDMRVILESADRPTDGDLISRAEALAYPLSFDHYDKENGSREFISGVESYREYIQHLPSVSVESKATENKYDCDLISRADALEQMAQAECGLHYEDCEADNCSCPYIGRILDIPSAETTGALDDAIAKYVADGLMELPVVRCKDCEYKVHCHQTVSHTKIHEDFREYWSEPIEWCSRAKMKGGAE